MFLKNTKEQFCGLTKMLHWSLFLLFLLQYFLVYRREYFPQNAPEKLQYILLHKSSGLLILALGMLMLFWRHIGTRPAMPSNMKSWEIRLAKLTHGLLYIAMLLMPISGITMSSFGGYPVAFFQLFTLPSVAKNKLYASLAHAIHVWASYIIIVIVSLHVLAALYHHFIKKDRVLTRMLP